MAKIYTGKRENNTVIAVEVITHQSGNKVRKRKLRHIQYHSPEGFQWSDGGSGSADLALAILVDYFRARPPRDSSRKFSRWTEKSQAWQHHQDFKWHFVAIFADEWELYDTQIEAWLKEKEKEE